MKYKRTEPKYLAVLACALLSCVVFAEPNNGSFEVFDYNEAVNRNEPNEWATEYLVEVAQGFNPNNYPGGKDNWELDITSDFNAFKGDSLLVLSTGDDSLKYSQVSQKITIQAGDKLTGAYFFGACDYRPYNDSGEIWLEPTINNPQLPPIRRVMYVDIEMLGSYGSFRGWKRFEYTFSQEEAGEYNLVVHVEDGIDQMLESYLLVDGLILCRHDVLSPPPEAADLDCDCDVDMNDFRWLANDWGYDCTADGTYDPKRHCLFGSDLDASGIVDFNDLGIMLDNWLAGVKEEE